MRTATARLCKKMRNGTKRAARSIGVPACLPNLQRACHGAPVRPRARSPRISGRDSFERDGGARASGFATVNELTHRDAHVTLESHAETPTSRSAAQGARQHRPKRSSPRAVLLRRRLVEYALRETQSAFEIDGQEQFRRASRFRSSVRRRHEVEQELQRAVLRWILGEGTRER